MTRRRFFHRVASVWLHARESLWFNPALFVLGAIALSTFLLWLDSTLGTASGGAFWLFGGNAQGARTVLSVIAGSLMTVIAVAFSVTIVALQQSSTQFTPRVLRKFTSDRGNQFVLGIYIATFCFALLVLRRVRESTGADPSFVPSLSISTAMLLALVSLFALIYFIHHLSESLQVGYLLETVGDELAREIDRLFPETLGRAEAEGKTFDEYARENGGDLAGPRSFRVCCDDSGYLRDLDLEALTRTACRRLDLLSIEVQVGEFLCPGQIVARGVAREPADDALVQEVLSAFQVDRDRSPHQDPLFAVQQLVDIALKAMSPGINDPTTAEQVLDHLGRCLTLLIGRVIPSPMRVLDGTRILVKAPSFADYISAAFSQIRAAARADLHVTLHLSRVLLKLGDATDSAERSALLRQRVEDTLTAVDAGRLCADDRELLRRALRDARGADGEPPAYSAWPAARARATISP